VRQLVRQSVSRLVDLGAECLAIHVTDKITITIAERGSQIAELSRVQSGGTLVAPIWIHWGK